MKVSLKMLTFCMIAVLLVLSYRKASNATRRTATRGKAIGTITAPGQSKTIISQIYGINSGRFNSSRGIIPPQVGATYSVVALYGIIQKGSRSADFIVTNANGTQSLGGANRVLGYNWQAKMSNPEAVTLRQGDFMDSKSIPSQTTLKRFGNPISPFVQSFIDWFIANYKKVTLYFNYPSDENPTHRLYITDPNPGDVKITGNKIIIPAYTNVLSKWNLE